MAGQLKIASSKKSKVNHLKKLEVIADYRKYKNRSYIANKYGISEKSVTNWTSREKDIKKEVEEGFSERCRFKRPLVGYSKTNLLRKLEAIIEYRKCKNYTSVGDKYGVYRKTVANWVVKEKDILRKIEIGSSEKHLEKYLYDWILSIRDIHDIITYNMIKVKAIELTDKIGIEYTNIYKDSKGKKSLKLLKISDKWLRNFSERYSNILSKKAGDIKIIIKKEENEDLLGNMTVYAEEDNFNVDKTESYTNELNYEYVTEDNFNIDSIDSTGMYSKESNYEYIVEDNFNADEISSYLKELSNYMM